MRVHEFDDVVTVARKGLVVVLPGDRWRPIRKAVLPRVNGKMCGKAAWDAIYDGLRLLGVTNAELGAWGRLGMIRLAVKMVMMGPRIECACRGCKTVRTIRGN